VPHGPGLHARLRRARPIPAPAQQTSGAARAGGGPHPFRGVRRTIAEKLRESVNTAVHFTVVDEADVTALDDLRRRYAEQTGQKISFLPVRVRRGLPG
jgi:pyruvate/2-oxoglutarate dehydrogenase complex dihydrolipoamide acyltransferase (E2) component